MCQGRSKLDSYLICKSAISGATSDLPGGKSIRLRHKSAFALQEIPLKH